MIRETGQCLCGAVAYEVTDTPRRVMICHCTFCQRATGGAYMVDALFRESDFRLTKGDPAQYTHVSDTSGKKITVNFCRKCGTKTHLTLEILPAFVGVYAGTFDTPDWFDRSPDAGTYIFAASAAQGTVLPAGAKVFEHGLTDKSGALLTPEVLIETRIISGR